MYPVVVVVAAVAAALIIVFRETEVFYRLLQLLIKCSTSRKASSSLEGGAVIIYQYENETSRPDQISQSVSQSELVCEWQLKPRADEQRCLLTY